SEVGMAAPTGTTGLDGDRSEWLTGILTHSPDVISILDLDARIVYLSRALPGADPRKFHGTLVVDLIPSSHQAYYLAAVKKAIEEKAAQRAEFLSISARWWDSRIIPIEREGVVTGLLTITSDITARKRAEAELSLRDAQLRLALEASGMGQWS